MCDFITVLCQMVLNRKLHYASHLKIIEKTLYLIYMYLFGVVLNEHQGQIYHMK